LCNETPFYRGLWNTLLWTVGFKVAILCIETPYKAGFRYSILRMNRIRSLSAQESKIVLTLTENGRRAVTRAEIAKMLGNTDKAADHVIASLRRKGWLERATWGSYLLIPPEFGPDALGNSNLLAHASHIADRYFIGFGSAAAHYGLTTQHRNVIYLVTPKRLREREIGDSRVEIVTQSERKFFGFEPVDVLGHEVSMSDREKTAIDCIDHPEFAGGTGEAASVFAAASRRRFNWEKAGDYLEKIGAGALARRFGWLADFTQADFPPDARARVLQVAARSRRTWLGSPQDHPVPRALGYDEKWKVFVNVSKEELSGIAGTARRMTDRKET
jgi:predicted transcriptional regulator of viral defense system